MSKILFFARDPGGANCIIPVIQKCKGRYDIIVYAKDVAYQRIREAGIYVCRFDEHMRKEGVCDCHSFLEEVAPDILVTGTSVDDYTERLLWKAASAIDIPSIAIIDQWTNLGIRFSEYDYMHEEEYMDSLQHRFVPSLICVMDDIAKKMMVNEGLDEKLIRVTGQPHFDSVRLKYDKLPSEERKGVTILFVSEPIFRDYDNYGKEDFWGFNEFSIFRKLVETIKSFDIKMREDLRLIVRPHPRDNLGEWKRVLEKETELQVSIDNTSNTFGLFRKTSLVCGMSSMMLLEAAICEVPIMSIMIGLKRNNPFILNNIGLCSTICEEVELRRKLTAFFEGDYQERMKFSYIKNATDNVISVIEEVLKKNGKTGD